ncbi:hypothetical protein MMC29_001886 [Sticta canariensis]|nr:hypothetical protein [Sticta canariensis]
MSPSIAFSRVAPPCSTSSSILSYTNFFAPPPRSVSTAVELAVAQQQSRASLLSLSTLPPSPSKHVWLAPARGSGPHHGVGRPLQEAFNIVGSRLPRARPSHTGPQVKHSFTFDFGGYAVHAATLESMRKPFPSPLKITQGIALTFTGRRSLKPAIKSILKKSASTMIATRPVSACEGPIDFSGSGLCRASAEVYAATWRSAPAQEWDIDNLPINRLDRCALHRQQTKKPELLAGGATSRRVEFADVLVSRRRIVSRWIVSSG